MILSLDAGTSCVKAALVVRSSSGALEVVGSASAPIPPPSSAEVNGGAEQHAATWFSAASSACAQALAVLPKEAVPVTLVALSGQMQSVLLLDANGAALLPALLYCDARAETEAAAIAEALGEARLMAAENWKGSVSILPKLRWLLTHAPAELEACSHIALSAHDFLFAQLTGGPAVTDPTNASTTGLLLRESSEAAYATTLLKDAGIPEALVGKLPRVACGADAFAPLSSAAAAALGLPPEGVRVHHGAGDLGTATVGARLACSASSTYVYLGTSGWVATVRPGGEPIEAPRAFCVRQPTGVGHIYAVPMTTAGGNIRWLCGLLFAGQHDAEALEAFNAEAAAAPPGCDGLLFLPYLRGERCPINDPKARACFVGLGADTTRGHMCRAVLEGICFAVRSLLELLPADESPPPHAAAADAADDGAAPPTLPPLPLVGGVGNSAVLAQSLSDVLQLRVVVPGDAAHVPAIGAAALAMAAAGPPWEESLAATTDCQAAASKLYSPTPEIKALYNSAYDRFCSLHPSLKDIFV